MKKWLKKFRKKKPAVESESPGAEATLTHGEGESNEWVSSEQRTADQEITERYKLLRGLGPFIK